MEDIAFPVEFFLLGEPVSAQAKNSASKDKWKAEVDAAAKAVLPEYYFCSNSRVKVQIIVFGETEIACDLDNATKPILDALKGVIICDDNQVFDLHVTKHLRSQIFVLDDPTIMLASVAAGEFPATYIKVSMIEDQK